MISRGLFALHNLMLFNSKFLIKTRVLLEAAWAAAAEFCVFNVIRETAGVGAEHPAHRQSQVGGGSSWDRHPEWCEACRKCPGTQPGLEMVGQFPSWLPRLASSWDSREWVVAICLSSLVTCAATDDSAQFAVCRAVCICIYSFSTSWHVGEYQWKRALGRFYPPVLLCFFWYAESLEIFPYAVLHFSLIQANAWCLDENCCKVKLWLFLMSGWCLNNMVWSRRSQSTFEFALLRLHGRVLVLQLPWPKRQPQTCIALYWLCNTSNLIEEP